MQWEEPGHGDSSPPPGLPWLLSGKESAYNVGDTGSIPGLGSSPGKGNSNPFQYYCLKNPMVREAWLAVVS